MNTFNEQHQSTRRVSDTVIAPLQLLPSLTGGQERERFIHVLRLFSHFYYQPKQCVLLLCPNLIQTRFKRTQSETSQRHQSKLDVTCILGGIEVDTMSPLIQFNTQCTKQQPCPYCQLLWLSLVPTGNLVNYLLLTLMLSKRGYRIISNLKTYFGCCHGIILMGVLGRSSQDL